MKSPPVQHSDERARQMVEEFIELISNQPSAMGRQLMADR
jgi:hypothetical protein